MNIVARIYFKLGSKKLLNFLTDKIYVKIGYFLTTGHTLNLRNPKTFFEKINRLKLNFQDYTYTNLVDKYEFKEYVIKNIGEQYIIPTLGIYNNFSDINFESLPNQFVMKCTHDSHSIIICKDKKYFNLEKARKKINKSLKTNYYWRGREYQYKNVKPRILIEQYMPSDNGDVLTDYKRFCFDGVAKFMYIGKDTSSSPTNNFYDMDFNQLDIELIDPVSKEPIQKPTQFNEMKKISEQISKNMPHARIDFYIINNKLYIGEITFHHNGGFAFIKPKSKNIEFGKYINLPKPLKYCKPQ